MLAHVVEDALVDRLCAAGQRQHGQLSSTARDEGRGTTDVSQLCIPSESSPEGPSEQSDCTDTVTLAGVAAAQAAGRLHVRRAR
jgi:hypothetical protein